MVRSPSVEEVSVEAMAVARIMYSPEAALLRMVARPVSLEANCEPGLKQHTCCTLSMDHERFTKGMTLLWVHPHETHHGMIERMFS